MNQEKKKFWITCPYCKEKFGVSPAIVMKYMDRLFGLVHSEIKTGYKKAEQKNRLQVRKKGG